MNGAQHFREAESYIGKAMDVLSGYTSPEGAMILLARAQVHALLALTAATAQAGVAPGGGQDRDAWDQVLNTEDNR